MLLTYTPDQALLFDTDPISWTEIPNRDPVSAKGRTTTYRHASGGVLRIYENAFLGSLHRYVLFNDEGQDTCIIESDDPSGRFYGLTGLLQKLEDSFSPRHRACMAEFVDRVALLLLRAGCSGEHTVSPPGPNETVEDLVIFDHRYQRVHIPFPEDLLQSALHLRATPALVSMTGDLLSASSSLSVCIPLPTSRHALMELRARLEEAHPEA